MKSQALIALLALVATTLITPAVEAQVNITTSAFVGSPYVWRGEVLSGGWVIQPTVTATYNGFYAAFFGNIDPEGSVLPSGNGNVHFNEADLSIGYGVTISGVALGAGYTFYTFPTPRTVEGEDEVNLLTTQEVFASAGMTTGLVQPSLFVAYDFDGDDDADNPLKGLYAEAKVGVPVDLGGQAYTFAGALGLDSGYFQRAITAFEDDETSLSHFALTGTTTLEAGPVSLSPLLGFQVNLDNTYKDLYGSTFFYGGFTVGF